MVVRHALLLIAATVVLTGQQAGSAGELLERAYAALEARQYDVAISHFRDAIARAPAEASIRKDLGYALLKIGESEAARIEFAEVMWFTPEDLHAALEYAFLCHETGKTAEARRIFNQVRAASDPELSATAEQAFQNIDRPLAEGIERWLRALKLNPGDHTAHRELATLAERRDDPALAAKHYLAAWRLRPNQRSLLVDYGRVSLALGQAEQAHAALLAAAYGSEPRAAEAARELLPPRYPYVYEFRQAVDLDPTNAGLRRELAFLLAAMGRTTEAERELTGIPEQLKERGEDVGPELTTGVRELAERSYRAGYLKDALKYYEIAHEHDPLDFRVILQLGWTHNVLGQDGQAQRWFNLARRSPDPAIASEAAKAYSTLRPAQARVRVSGWLFPSYSSRWEDVFTYGQVKVEGKLGALPLRAYLSTRFIGDSRHISNDVNPQYLSESSFILGVGLATDYWHGIMLWGEAGSAASYLGSRNGVPRLAPDYRGGVAVNKGFGRLLGSRRSGAFLETNDDGVFVSRFDNDIVVYSQNRFGLTLAPARVLDGLQTQWYWNLNASADLRHRYWANTAETGPGLRLRWAWMPSSWVFSVNLLRGGYTVMDGNPREQMYRDLRIGMWYAVTR